VRPRRPRGPGFWGDDSTAEAVKPIAPADEPAALLRSLGPSPLHGPRLAADLYLELVVRKAAGMATALAAQAGLLETDEQD